MPNGTNGWPLNPDGSIAPARWMKLWQRVLNDFEKPAYAATVETVALFNSVLATSARNLLHLKVEVAQVAAARSQSNMHVANALLATAQKTSDPSALYLAVAYPLAFQGDKSALAVTAELLNAYKTFEPVYTTGESLENFWNETVEEAGQLASTVGEYLGEGLEAAKKAVKAAASPLLAIGAGLGALYVLTR